MTDNSFACVPAYGALPSIVTKYPKDYEETLHKGCEAADEWMDTRASNHFFEDVNQQCQGLPFHKSIVFNIGYMLRLEQRLKGYFLFDIKPLADMLEQFNGGIDWYIEALERGLGNHAAEVKGMALGRIEQAQNTGLISESMASYWQEKVLTALKEGAIQTGLKKRRATVAAKKEKLSGGRYE